MTAVARQLGELLAACELNIAAPAEVDGETAITDVVYDSRRVGRGSLFCCIPGTTSDGHDFAAEAVAAGATALLCERRLPLEVPQVLVTDARAAMGPIAAAFHGRPSRELLMVGITGTNGKTTTCGLLASILEEAGFATGVIGTLTGVHTTPEAPDLQRNLAEFVANGKRAAVLEVSSHALTLHRVAGCHFELGVFTNLGRDHLDLHETVDRYFAAKSRLFEPDLVERGVSNIDDPYGRQLARSASIPMTGFGIGDVSGVEVTPVTHSYRWRDVSIKVAIGGAFNVMNSLAAATAAATLGIATGVIAKGLEHAPVVPGRFEPVSAGQAFSVIVDFAHTPDGLREVLSAARAAITDARRDEQPSRVVVVFGCGGDRDRDKRPEMGAVASELADAVVVTSDNPRSEDPMAIINAVLAGVPDDYRDRVVSETDRRQAFAVAFQMARPGDVVVIAGKGHESTQTIGAERIPFLDRDVASELLIEMGTKS